MTLSASEFNFIKALVLRTSGNVLESQRDYLVDSRLSALADRENLNSVQGVLARLRDSSRTDLVQRVAEALVNNETFFFRDIYPFQLLKDEVLPEIIAARQNERAINIWCAACSSGQEPYSIAMILRENFSQLSGWNIKIIASDFSQTILQRAAQGRYSQLEINRGLPAPLLIKYFERAGTEWQLNESIRSMVTFSEVNLLQPLPSALRRIDIVFLRNALIYFDVDKKRQVMSQMETVMRPGGYLFLGAAETTMNISAAFDRRFQRASCYQLQGKR